jgi:hypothetical protein
MASSQGLLRCPACHMFNRSKKEQCVFCDTSLSGADRPLQPGAMRRVPSGRGLHSSTFQLNLSRFGPTSPCSPV